LNQSGHVTIEDQPQCRWLWHRGSPSARSFSRSPAPPPPSFTQSPSPPRSLVRDGQTSPQRPWLVDSRSTCPPLSPSPNANSFVIGTVYCSNKHTHRTRSTGRFAADDNARGNPFQGIISKWERLFCLLVLDSVTSTPQ
jgi:hypothetical protein